MKEILMLATVPSPSRAIRARLTHPILDADGHLVEFQPPIEDYLRAVGGNDLRLRFISPFRRPVAGSLARRREQGAVLQPWWGVPTRNTLDRATAALPKLLYERMGDMGLDFTVLFTTTTSFHEVYREGDSTALPSHDPELQRILARATNAYRADICREFADRMTPVARVPMETPAAAIEDLQYVVGTLGLKAITISAQRRPIPAIHRDHPELFPAVSVIDTYGIDSPHDYDPFWKRCAELKVPVMTHGQGSGYTGRNSPSNFVYNHIGHFADAAEAMCKSIFLGGVTRRFPSLRFAFLEGGVAWGCRVYADLVGHWQKRHGEGLANYDPAHLDRDRFRDLHVRYGGPAMQAKLDQVLRVGAGVEPDSPDADPALDDWAASGVRSVEDIRALFVDRFFFGCEADDPANAIAFDRRLWPLGVRLQPVLGSDIGHWDVPDMTKVLAEAYELVERQLMSEADFRDFTFTNAIRLFAGANPEFFKGTAVEAEVAEALRTGVGVA
jgi:predicted TIM-barrel fold metal-dependent hydrolase